MYNHKFTLTRHKNNLPCATYMIRYGRWRYQKVGTAITTTRRRRSARLDQKPFRDPSYCTFTSKTLYPLTRSHLKREPRMCSVFGCDSWRRSAYLFKLPEDPDRRLLWVQFLFRINGQRVKEWSWTNITICSEHFSDDFLINVFPSDTPRLKSNAVPSLCMKSEPEEFETCQVKAKMLFCYTDTLIQYVISTQWKQTFLSIRHINDCDVAFKSWNT